MNTFDGLLNYHYKFFTGKKGHLLDCWLEFEDGDPSVGLSESWSVFHAYLGGVDISELLSEEVKTQIIEEAQLVFMGYNEPEEY